MDLGTVWCENKVNWPTSGFWVLARVGHYRREPSGFTKKEISWPDQNQLLKAIFYCWRSKGVSFRRSSLSRPWRHIMGFRGIYLL